MTKQVLKINVHTQVTEIVPVDVDVSEVIRTINMIPLPRRWEYLELFLKEIDLKSDPFGLNSIETRKYKTLLEEKVEDLKFAISKNEVLKRNLELENR